MSDNNEIAKVDSTQKIARFQTFKAGEYWKALSAIAERNIEESEVLLIESIRWVDEKSHTVVIRAHPSKYDRYVTIEYVDDDGETRTRNAKYTTHEFLVDDFLNRFEHEPEADSIREDELSEARQFIDDLQRKFVATQSDPDKMQAIVDAGLSERADKSDEETLPARQEDLHALGEIAKGSASDAVSGGITESAVEQVKSAIEQQRQIAEVKSDWIQKQTSEITDAVSRLTPYFEEKAAAALSATQDARTYAETLRKGIDTLDLYVGKGVDVETICEGESAPYTAPLSFMQKRLWMDEELAVFADVGAQFDFRNHKAFDEVLRSEPGLVNQIFPKERCVVAMATNRFVDYGDPHANHVNNMANQHAFLMIRDGGNIYRVYSSIDSHGRTPRLFPSQDDQDRIFRGFDGKNINFDDVEFSRRHSRHGDVSLHYKRFLILMAGLDHRLKLFGEFYPRDAGNNFVSIEFQETFCEFVHDDDGHGMLPGEKRPPFHEWLKERNSQLRSGSRVLCHWSQLMNRTTAPSACERPRWNDYGKGGVLYNPEKPFNVVVAYRDKKDICVKIRVSGETYDYKERSFESRVNLSAYDPSEFDDEEFPYLVLDSVHPDDLRWYINNRTQRTGHVTYIRLFKRALEAVEADRAVEADARQRLKGAILAQGVASDDVTAEGIADRTVSSWRASRRGLSFPKFDGNKPPRGWDVVLDLAKGLSADRELVVGEIEGSCRDMGLVPLRICLTGRGDFMLYAAPRDEERDDRMTPFVWVHKIRLDASKRERSRSWVILPKSDAGEEILKEYPEASDWLGLESDFVSPDEKAGLFTRAGKGVSQLRGFVEGSGDFEELLESWQRMRSHLSGKYVVAPCLSVPIGLHRDQWGKNHFICLSARFPDQVVYRAAKTDSDREGFRKAYTARYVKSDLAGRDFDSQVVKGPLWFISLLPLKGADLDRNGEPFCGFHGYDLGTPADFPGKNSFDASFKHWIERPRHGGYVWLSPDACDENGGLSVDSLFVDTLTKTRTKD